jgi:hypothetical protein
VAIGAGIAHAGVHIALQYPRQSHQMEPMCRCDINDYQSSLGSATIPVSSRSSPFIILYFSRQLVGGISVFPFCAIGVRKSDVKPTRVYIVGIFRWRSAYFPGRMGSSDGLSYDIGLTDNLIDPSGSVP